MEPKIIQKEAFSIVGVKKEVDATEEGLSTGVTDLWGDVSEEVQSELLSLSEMEPSGLLHAVTDDEKKKDTVIYYYGSAVSSDFSGHENYELLHLPASTWAIFETEGGSESVAFTWAKVYAQWFPTSGYQHTGEAEILKSQDGHNEIWVPVLKR